MLVTNSHYKYSDTDLKGQESSFIDKIFSAFEYCLNRMAEAGKPHADRPLLSVELALCVAQCMGRKQYLAVQTAGLG